MTADTLIRALEARRSGSCWMARCPAHDDRNPSLSIREDGGKRIWKKGPRQVLYRLPEILEAPIVFVAEGEKDVETLRTHGFVATTNAAYLKARRDTYKQGIARLQKNVGAAISILLR